jgi:hypothetical protein
VPLQRVVEPDALSDEPLAMVDQQPNVEFRPGQLGRRQRLNALGERRARDRDSLDAAATAMCGPVARRLPLIDEKRQPGRAQRTDGLVAIPGSGSPCVEARRRTAWVLRIPPEVVSISDAVAPARPGSAFA